jgi:hypothetical protein
MRDDTDAGRIARRAASRLADRIEAKLPDQVEQILAADSLERGPERILDPISFAALIVSLASFGWTIYRDLKKDRAAALADRRAMERRIAGLLREEDGFAAGILPPGTTEEQQALVLEVVAAEIVAADPPLI